MKGNRRSGVGDARHRAVIDMEREPRWAGGRFRLRRRPERTRSTMPLWARLGLRLGWPTSVVLATAAIAAAALACALLALAVFLPTLAR